MVKRSKRHNKAVSNPVLSFLSGITTLATATATKIRYFTASIVTKAGQFVQTSLVSADDPVAGKSLWSFLRRITASTPRVPAKPDNPPTPTPAEPATSPVAQHPPPVPVAQPSLPPRIETLPGTNFDNGPPIGEDNTDFKIDSNGKAFSGIPRRISQRINRYKKLSKLFDTWLIAYGRHYPSWGRQSRRAPTNVAIEAYEGMAEEFAHRVNKDVAVRRHVQEIVELRGYVNRWFQNVILCKGLPATCGIAEEARSHIPPYEAMVAVLKIFGGPVP
ncbi:hypothetical protein LTR56_005511 [Elasticomyces elasticus]|nr:hypothetical protein LTR22_017896 [Elasticomyces elasticus]KAK3651703.1 hypothetical protein LTR56_005511 [Elasticomyces elasticus]KAK4912881.1 hypothetical protein LTR49_018737 [Elasticomyces elasticus]KAK5769198.1 hypothetical protein LTS12_000549 [Elasticomyces elasticus]